jgi:hypothetical protein
VTPSSFTVVSFHSHRCDTLKSPGCVMLAPWLLPRTSCRPNCILTLKLFVPFFFNTSIDGCLRRAAGPRPKQFLESSLCSYTCSDNLMSLRQEFTPEVTPSNKCHLYGRFLTVTEHCMFEIQECFELFYTSASCCIESSLFVVPPSVYSATIF